MNGDEEVDRVARATQHGRRRSAAESVATDDSAEQPVSSKTRVGTRDRNTPVAETAGTQLGRRQADAPGHETGVGRRGAPAADHAGTQLGRRAPLPGETVVEPDEEGIVRFGPGVPRTPAAPEWSARPAVRRRRGQRPWIGALITVALAAGVIAWLLTRAADPIQAHAAQVTAVSPAGACTSDVDVVGTIATNGRPGSITYQWSRNDGQPTDVLTQTVASGATSTQVHLHWSFSGRGRFDAVATLRVLDPGPASRADGAFTYSCS